MAGWKRHMKNCMWHQCAQKFGPCFDTSGIAIQIWSVRIMFSYSSHRCATQLGSQPWGLTQLYQGVPKWCGNYYLVAHSSSTISDKYIYIINQTCIKYIPCVCIYISPCMSTYYVSCLKHAITFLPNDYNWSKCIHVCISPHMFDAENMSKLF